MSQRQLAEAVGVDHSYISFIEADARQPSLEVFEAIGRTLGTSIVLLVMEADGTTLEDLERAVMAFIGRKAR